MNWLQIKQQAELYRRDPVVYPKRWFNEGKALLANMYTTACKLYTQEYPDVNLDETQVLPDGCRYIKKVVSADSPTYLYTTFSTDISSNEIMFKTPGSYIVTYLKETDDIVGTDSEVPTIHVAYHYPLAKYIAAKEVEYVRPDWYQQLIAQFYQEVDMANKSLTRGTTGVQTLPKRRFR